MPLRRADELLAALLARQQAAPILEKTTGLPYGWALWLRALTPLPRPFHARDVIEVLLPRPQPAAPGRLPALGFAQALRRLFWQGWDPPPRDQRWMRWVASLTSALLHVLFFVLLLWVALIRPPVKEQEGGEGERVQVEFLGQGAQEGGGDQPGAAEAIAAAANAAAAAAQAEAEAAGWATPTPPSRTPPTAQATPAPTTPAPAAAPPSPAEPAVAAEPLPTPPVQATEVAEASTDFVVPLVSAVRTEVRVVPRAQDTPVVRERSVQTVEAPRVPVPVVTPQVRVPQREVQAPQVREREIAQVDPAPAVQAVRPADVQVRTPQRELQVQEREVQVVSTESVQMARVAVREPGARDRPSPQVAVRERTVSAREPAPAASSATAASAPAPNASAATPASGSAAAPANASTARSAAQAGQAGARPTPTPGNWATPARGDDWGASSHERPGSSHGAQAASGGQGAGLFNADGSVRVPGQEGAAQSPRGAPGGDNDGWTKDRIAQSGTWLKRPPYDYTPTSFDKYWVPQESLLAEWVRKGIKAMEIPLPGTSTRISCVISILQAGGGCGLTDPNMQDQPAIARPPPDIPFKKELQEDNGSR